MADDKPKPQIMIGGVKALPKNEQRNMRFSGLFWGQSGVGKSTLAATMPGPVAHIFFDYDGYISVADMPGVECFDLSRKGTDIITMFKEEGNPLGIRPYINDFNTFVVDSMTSAIVLALAQGIKTTAGATLERPSPGAYGARNALALSLMRNMVRLTGAHNKHCIFIAHEDAPEKDKEGNVISIGISVGGKLTMQIPADISEVWHLSEVENTNSRRIAVRPTRMRSPMKTRMFDISGPREFMWTYNSVTNTPAEMRLDGMYDAWRANGFSKIPLPVAAKVPTKASQ